MVEKWGCLDCNVSLFASPPHIAGPKYVLLCCTVIPTLTYSLHMADTCVAEVDLHTALNGSFDHHQHFLHHQCMHACMHHFQHNDSYLPIIISPSISRARNMCCFVAMCNDSHHHHTLLARNMFCWCCTVHPALTTSHLLSPIGRHMCCWMHHHQLTSFITNAPFPWHQSWLFAIHYHH